MGSLVINTKTGNGQSGYKYKDRKWAVWLETQRQEMGSLARNTKTGNGQSS